jgi:hypothetical protein
VVSGSPCVYCSGFLVEVYIVFHLLTELVPISGGVRLAKHRCWLQVGRNIAAD